MAPYSLVLHRFLGAVVIVLTVSSLMPGTIPRAAAANVTFVVEMLAPNRFSPTTLQVAPGDSVTIVVFNNDSIGHTFDLNEFNVHLGTATNPMQPNENRTATFIADRPGTFWFFCAVPGHASPRGDGSYSGMAGRLVVGEPTSGGDFTWALAIGGVAAAIVVATAIFAWARRRRPKA